MKTGYASKFLLLCFCMALFACTKTEPEPGPGPGPDPENPAAITFTKRLLIEDYTGIWCGNCPRVSKAIELLAQQTDNMIPVAIHRKTSVPGTKNYDPFNFDASAIESKYGILGYPYAMLDRSTKWKQFEYKNLDQAKKMINTETSIGISVNPTLFQGQLNATVNIKMGKDYTNKGLKLVVYVLEDNLTETQVNYTDFYGGGKYIANFDYDHVLRASMTDLFGQEIPNTESEVKDIFTVTLSMPLKATNVTNTENLSIVAFVINREGDALNVRSAILGDQQDFVEIK